MTTVPTRPQKARLALYESFSAPTRALLALDAGRMGSWSLNISNGEVVGDRFLANLLGLDYDRQPWDMTTFYEVVDPADSSHVHGAVNHAWTGENKSYDVEFRRRRMDDASPLLWLGARGQVTERSEDGTPLYMVGVIWDVTHQKVRSDAINKQAENTFGLVRRLIDLGESTSDFAATLRAQIDTISTVHSILMHAAAGVPISIREVLDASLASFLVDGPNEPSHLVIDCDPDIAIHPDKVLPLAMFLSEITKNTARREAISATRNSIELAVMPKTSDEIVLNWTETTSGIDDRKNHVEGDFCTSLLDDFASQLGGTAVRTRHTNKLTLELTVNLVD